jgi:hypothetical protein
LFVRDCFFFFFFSIFFLSPILINILLHAILFQISSFLDLINSSSIRILLFSNYLSLIIFCLIDISLPLNCELFLIKITDRFTYFLQVWGFSWCLIQYQVLPFKFSAQELCFHTLQSFLTFYSLTSYHIFYCIWFSTFTVYFNFICIYLNIFRSKSNMIFRKIFRNYLFLNNGLDALSYIFVQILYEFLL